MPDDRSYENRQMRQRVEKLLDARTEHAAIEALKEVFVSELDFDLRSGNIPLSGPDLPGKAVRIAERAGVQVVTVQLPTQGRVLIRNIREALKQIRQTLNGDILLVAGDVRSGEWQLVYPSSQGGREILRRIVLHRDQPCRTVVEQLAQVYRGAKTGDLRAALESIYDVEAVTREFFREYKRVFEDALGLITGPEGDQRRLFTQTLFNRLMFIYFLQRKARMRFAGRTDYLQALWADAQAKHENFYDERLRSLFFVGLSNPRSRNDDDARHLLESTIGEVPFLNGGLFSETDLDMIANVCVPNEAIKPLLHDVFERFNFTIAESTPYDVQVAVDPEMLGKVFEELVTGRHGTGSYYTPRPIVAFMCREALKGHLRNRVPTLTTDAVNRYIDVYDVRSITPTQARDILTALEEITVVDPACGSGAYLLGMMQEILELEDHLYSSQLAPDAVGLYDRKLRIIQRNVYGVDIDPFAVNIAMLRLWLSLMVEYGGPGDPPALPNLDFKIIQGDSVGGPNPDVPPATLIESAVQRIAHELAEFKALYAVATGEEKNSLHRDVEARQEALTELMAQSDVPPGTVDWRVAFAEVFERGGFDVVLANPPYVRQELITEQKPRLKRVYGVLYSGTADLYVFFYYRALQLLRDGGMLVFISSNKWFRAAYGAKLRALLAGQATIWSITDFGDLPVFQAATAYPMIFVAQRGGATHSASFTNVPSLGPPYPDITPLIQKYGFSLVPEAISGADWLLAPTETIARLQRMRVRATPLGEYVGGKIYYGVKTGFNQAFVIDGATRTGLIAADPKSEEIIKPFIVGKDIQRWAVDYQDRWLIFTRRGIDINAYPSIREYLRRWQEELTPKRRGIRREQPGRKPGSYKWYEIQDDVAYYPAFESAKIVYPVIADAACFAHEDSGAYSNDKTFILAVDDLFLLGLLNSTSGWFWLRERCSPLQHGFREFRAFFLEQFPVPTTSRHDRSVIEQLVAKCLAAHRQNQAVAELEAEIDIRIANLYDLGANDALAK